MVSHHGGGISNHSVCGRASTGLKLVYRKLCFKAMILNSGPRIGLAMVLWSCNFLGSTTSLDRSIAASRIWDSGMVGFGVGISGGDVV